jgi:sterol desaturase/sphingolipid hydroxylase (fatty acid hydroxylase superfamily)
MEWILPALASAAAMSAIVAVRYLITSGGFAWLTRLLHPHLYDSLGSQIRSEIKWSLLSASLYGVPAGILLWGWDNFGWTKLYWEPSHYPLFWLPLSIFAYLLLHDTWFYWTHRWMHRPAIYRRVQAVHHASHPPTAWAAMSFHPWESVTGAVVIPVLILTVPIHVGALAAVLTIMTVMGVTNHMGWEIFPRALVHGRAGNWLITASHHQLHHQRNKCNYGLYFRFWDRLCATDGGLGSFEPRGRRAGSGRAAGDQRHPGRDRWAA